MGSALDYITWRGDLSFEVAPINEVDLFLCTQVAMADLQGIVSGDRNEISFSEAAEQYFSTHDTDVKNLGVLQAEDALPACLAMSRAKRYRNLMLSRHVNRVCNEDNEQFSATVFRFSPDVFAVVFRGTDDSIIGWKEDCHMAIYDGVPAQTDALHYLEQAAAELEGKIIVAGHSKGGNLAVYASSKAAGDVQDRIVHVFNYDGPGFSGKFIERNEGYKRIKNRISTLVSQNSIVGMLMETPGKVSYTVSSAEGLLAHDGFTWEVAVNHFTRCGGLSRFSREFKRSFSNTINQRTAAEKAIFVDELFDILFKTGAGTVTEIRSLDFITSANAVSRMTASKPIRDFLNSLIMSMLSKN